MDPQGNTCPLCLKLFDDPRWMPCKHIYCFKCIPRLRRRDRHSKHRLVLECCVCAKRFGFPNWSTVKYYVTLHCVPYLKAIQFTSRSITATPPICAACFQKTSEDSSPNKLEYCIHCQKNLCRSCSLKHRNESKKNILRHNEQCRLLTRKHHQRAEEIVDKLNNLKTHLDSHACELIDRIDAYCDRMLIQIGELKSHEELDSSSGYGSFIDQSVFDIGEKLPYPSNPGPLPSEMSVSLTEPSLIPMSNLIGQWLSSISPSPTLLWSLPYSHFPAHLVFESSISKLFICNEQGFVSIFDWTRVDRPLVDSFSFHSNSMPSSGTIKSLAVSPKYLIALTHSTHESLLYLYSHTGLLRHSFSFYNEYISQIRYDNGHLWYLSVTSSSIFSMSLPINGEPAIERRFLSFQKESFDPFRFALNQLIIAVLDRSSVGVVRLFHKQTAAYLKQIILPSIDVLPCDIELTNLLLIYRFSHRIAVIQLENDQCVERIDSHGTRTIAIGKTDTEILLSTISSDLSTFVVQCYVR